jgi:RNA polymerase-binding transcription factor DksA
MSTAEINGIKLNLISWINQLSDKETISFLENLRISNAKNDWWEELSQAQQKQIELGINDAKEGKLKKSKEFWKKIKNE